jgi:hypothetical protein
LFVTLAAGWLGWLLALPPRPSPWLVVLSGLPLVALSSWIAHRGRPEPWREFVRSTADGHLLALVLLAALGVQFADAHGVTTDGVIYFSQLRSVIFDRDLDVAAEFAFLQQPPRPYHVVPIGPTFVWLPLYVSVAAVDTVGRTLGLWTAPADPAGIGLTLPYVRAALVSSFAHRGAGPHRDSSAARPRVLARRRVCGDPAAVSRHAARLVHGLRALDDARGVVRVRGAVRGGGGAVDRRGHVRAAVARARGAAGAGVHDPSAGSPLCHLSGDAVALCCRATERAAARVGPARRMGLGRRAAVSRAAGAPFRDPLQSRSVRAGRRGGYLDFLRSRWADTLWSSWHGFFSWTPVAYLAFIAMFFYAVRHRGWAIAAVVIVLAMAWVNGSTADWNAGWSFGGRRFTSVLVVLAPGIALMIHGLTRRPMVALVLMAAGAATWNHLLTMQYEQGLLVRPGAPVSFAQIVRQQAALATAPPFVYPFAFPANAWFAWRTGLTIDHYDLLGPESLRSSIDLDMTADASRYLVEGWGARVSDPFGELRWIDGDRAELLLPLDLPADRPIRVAWTARTRQLTPPESATFALVINGRETFRFTPDTEQSSFFDFTVPPGSDLFVRGFNRVRFERRSGSPPVAVYRFAVGREN